MKRGGVMQSARESRGSDCSVARAWWGLLYSGCQGLPGLPFKPHGDAAPQPGWCEPQECGVDVAEVRASTCPTVQTL